MMTPNDLEIYLSEALDQEACKPTLTEALKSRVIALQQRGISNMTVLICLENLCDDDYQLNDDVIADVMDWLVIGFMDTVS